MHSGEAERRGGLRWASVPVLNCHHHHHDHAEVVALGQQSSPFKGKTDPVPNKPPLQPCLHYPTSPGNNTCPRPKHESPLIRQNFV
jgi:hypothetical protein